MRLRSRICASGFLTAVCLAIPSLAAAAPMAPDAASSPQSLAGAAPACGQPAPGQVRCDALISTNRAGRAVVSDSPSQGYGPADLHAAYNLPSGGGSGQVIAVVDAYDDPGAEADLGIYRANYGLPACTTGNGCFERVNEAGVQGGYPQADTSGGWEAEESLDLDMVSAACPDCHILLVEADSPAASDLGAGVDTAVNLGANVVSNSYTITEGQGMQAFYPYYQHPGHVIVAASGDYGYQPANFPAVAPGVLAVGGTSLSPAHNRRGWTEAAWGHGSLSYFEGGSGSGCSAYVAKPAWQDDKYCHMRTITDVSADADPQTGVAVYDSTPNPYGPAGWMVLGGTSASTPFIAGVIGLAGNSATFNPGYAYTHSSSFFGVTSGSNGSCGKDYLCTAKSGYDGPTGLGTPDGPGGF